MPHKLTTQELETLRLIQRTPKSDLGWAKCTPGIFEALVESMPGELVEHKTENDIILVRLTDIAKTIVDWT